MCSKKCESREELKQFTGIFHRQNNNLDKKIGKLIWMDFFLNSRTPKKIKKAFVPPKNNKNEIKY